jgi:UDP-2,3-diacylglucosamine hydrolase
VQAPADFLANVWQVSNEWRVIDFISDLHLQAAEPANFDTWQRYMQHTHADAVFILGDLFEVWVGDDAATPGSFEQQCATVIHSTAQRTPVFFMHGNRDFLVGAAFMAQCNATWLPDPTVLSFAGKHFVLSHGDALCLADTAYQQFRETVRSEPWQNDFLAKPLVERLAIARGLRAQSEAQKESALKSAFEYADVDTTAAVTCLQAAQANHLIHGHTHRPADHVLPGRLHRVVLSDWDAGATPPRAEVLRLALNAPEGTVSLCRMAPELA